ncbi:VOC family protein [Flavobacterium sp. J372]|uniref:VOC family protein n=1 Tax=Flavobacterium sp. J372 TaxID=2898436 RepID=UPI002150F2F2|nr:VOC family protein [Flavobacterium sp. J372]MCR5862375.1 VOC family protein [Flavobacterium sp. J372]
MSSVKQMFLNLPVKDLRVSIDFFTKIGFSFDQTFTNEQGTCMIIGENIYAMLLTEEFYSTFITKSIADARQSSELITALAVGSRHEVDKMVDSAVAAGATGDKIEDHGWMYGRYFEDPDGHIWQIFYMDMNAIPKE